MDEFPFETLSIPLAVDPWGNDYTYRLFRDRPVAICLGKDAAPGGSGENEDSAWTIDQDQAKRCSAVEPYNLLDE